MEVSRKKSQTIESCIPSLVTCAPVVGPIDWLNGESAAAAVPPAAEVFDPSSSD
jgi:hypothetical protein